ncbi:MAG TPA: hypothetical protein VMZ73_10795 [Acidimicrobiales bacterium]|nr:hypothetical protein [Acidimicrobiales bacterium]
MQSHPQNFTCDGSARNQRFRIDTLEQGFGSLVRGVAYVQFCLVSAEGELLISDPLGRRDLAPTWQRAAWRRPEGRLQRATALSETSS